MKALRKQSALAHQPRPGSPSSGFEGQSPKQSASASSGTYRAVRPTEQETAARASGEALTDDAKVEGLRFEIEVGLWRGEAERIAARVIEDAVYDADHVGAGE